MDPQRAYERSGSGGIPVSVMRLEGTTATVMKLEETAVAVMDLKGSAAAEMCLEEISVIEARGILTYNEITGIMKWSRQPFGRQPNLMERRR